MNFKTIAIFGKPGLDDISFHAFCLSNYLELIGFKVILDNKSFSGWKDNLDVVDKLRSKLGDYVNLVQIVDPMSQIDQIDLAIVIGGDGTMLSVARLVVDHKIPVLGINQGRLGFMTDIAIDSMNQEVYKILIDKQYTIGDRNLFIGEVYHNNDKIMSSVALNDIVISRGAVGNMIEFDIYINNQFVLSQKSDGVIFATPTGSTAYALAAGGPILDPEAEAFSIVPICPQSLSNRPLVVSNNSKIELILTRDNSTQIHFDGQVCFDLQINDKVVLKKHVNKLKFIHPIDYNYYHTLRCKLYWSKRVS